MKTIEITDWMPYVGKRCLVTNEHWRHDQRIIEVVVLEVSPSKKMVKFQFTSYVSWEKSDTYYLFELLKEAEWKQLDDKLTQPTIC